MGIWKQGNKWKFAVIVKGVKYYGCGFPTRSLALMAREKRRSELLTYNPPTARLSLLSSINLYLSHMEKRVVSRTLNYKRFVLLGLLSSFVEIHIFSLQFENPIPLPSRNGVLKSQPMLTSENRI